MPERVPVEPLWREVAGEQLRARRRERGERLVDVAERAGVSPQYLSEVERGLKDPSSELLAAITVALGLTLGDLSSRVARSVPRGPLCLAA
jgi:transcriptional regulator with XRE-family HTH domain